MARRRRGAAAIEGRRLDPDAQVLDGRRQGVGAGGDLLPSRTCAVATSTRRSTTCSSSGPPRIPSSRPGPSSGGYCRQLGRAGFAQNVALAQKVLDLHKKSAG